MSWNIVFQRNRELLLKDNIPAFLHPNVAVSNYAFRLNGSFCHVFCNFFFFLKRKPSFKVLECLGVRTVSVLNSPLV